MLSHIELLTKSNLLLLRKQPRAPSTGYGTIPIKHLTKKKHPVFPVKALSMEFVIKDLPSCKQRDTPERTDSANKKMTLCLVC